VGAFGVTVVGARHIRLGFDEGHQRRLGHVFLALPRWRHPMQRTIVLVHGAWHGAWCWDAVVARLDAEGRRSIAADLPSVSSTGATLADDAACVRAALDAVHGEGLLVGHSYGGGVVTE